MAGLADQLHEAMDPEVSKAKKAMDDANKAWQKSRVAWSAKSATEALEKVAKRVESGATPEQAWKDALWGYKPSIIGSIASLGLPRFTRKAVKSHELVPTQDEIRAAREHYKKLDIEYEARQKEYSVAAQRYREATGAARKAAKQAKGSAQGKGICQACFRAFDYAPGPGTIVKHGWQEMGGRKKGQYGMAMHSGACAGVGQVPFQVSKDFSEHIIAELGKAIAAVQAMSAAKVSTEAELRQPKYADGAPYVLSLIFQAGKGDQEKRERAIPRALDTVLKSLRGDREYAQSMVKGWKRDDAWIRQTTWPKRAK